MLAAGSNGQVLTLASGVPSWSTPTTGTVTSVAQSFTGGLISVSGSPITSSGTLALTVAGTSGGIPYFSSASTWASSGALTQYGVVYGGGAAGAPAATAAGTTGQILVGNTGAAPSWAALSSSAVTSISFGTTGLTPSTATQGAVSVAGTLVVSNGGTGVSTLSGLAFGNGTSAFTAATAAQIVSAIGATAVTNATNATNATNTAITDDTTTAAVVYPTWVTTTTGNLPQKTSSTKFQFNPSTGVLTVTGLTVSNTISGSISGNAATATTATTANATNTSNNFQMNSLGVGTAGSGTAGEIRATNNVTAYYSSDKKFKENVQDIENALFAVKDIGGKTFDWTDSYIAEKGGEDGYFVQKQDFGVIAQDVLRVFPRAVRKRPDGSLAVDYEKLVSLAFAAIVDLDSQLEKLKGK